MIDLRGHGFSTGSRFDWLIEELHTDIITLIKVAENDVPSLPLFVFGHSLGGGLISSLFIKNQYLQVNGIILSAPLLGNPLMLETDAFKSFILDRVGNDLRVSFFTFFLRLRVHVHTCEINLRFCYLIFLYLFMEEIFLSMDAFNF